MEPEMVAREACDHAKADVWSAGIIWLMMLTRSPLFAIASPSQKGYTALANHGVGVVHRWGGLSGRVSDETIDLLAQMLQIDPAKRISMATLLTHHVVRTTE